MNHPIYVIAHNIRSLHNVGSIFRSADCFGIDKIYLTGYTGQPPRPDIHKVALGAEDVVPWNHHESVSVLIDQLKSEGVQVIALETGEGAVPIGEYVQNGPVALLLGNEVMGVSDDHLKKVDQIVEIPMLGTKSSLNVSVATGVALYALRMLQK